MRIRVDEIPDSGKVLRFRWEENRLRDLMPPDDPTDLEMVRPLQVNLELQKRKDHIEVKGTIETELRLACHRCLQPFLWTLDEKVDTILLKEQPVAEEDDELELDREDLDFDFFDGEVIDVDQMVAEQVFLALPYKVLCSESCRGLCARCGADLNVEECTCVESASDSPFARLKALKDRSA